MDGMRIIKKTTKNQKPKTFHQNKLEGKVAENKTLEWLHVDLTFYTSWFSITFCLNFRMGFFVCFMGKSDT